MVVFEDVKNVTAEEYFNNDEFAINGFNKKYCHYKSDGSIENPAEVFYRVAKGLDFDNKYTDIWFSLMYEGWFRPGGSILSGVGASFKSSLFNCSTIPLKGDSLEDIARCDYDVMKCAAFRQGIGVDFSNLRPLSSRINNAAQKSTGVVPWMSKIVDNGKYVGQLGRMPALLGSLKDKHPDIFDFIQSKVDKQVMENVNISVQLSNEFMEQVEVDGMWELRFDFEDDKYPSISREVKAVDLFNHIAETAYNTAEPGVQFIDLFRSGSITHQVYEATGDERYKVISTNACSEKPLPAYSVCNLFSVNMGAFSFDNYKEELLDIVPYIVKMADNVVDYELENNLSPLPEQRWIMEQTREIGLGITNIHGWLLGRGLQYDSDEAIDVVEDFFKNYAYAVFNSSVNLGAEKGNAPAFDEVSDKEVFMRSSYFKNIVDNFYDGVPTCLRNMAHMSVAPTGSISSTFPTPCVSSGIEPIISPCYWRKTRIEDRSKYKYYFIIPNQVKDIVLSYITDKEDYDKLDNFSGSVLDETGSIGEEFVDLFKKYLPEGLLKHSHEINVDKKIELLSRLYNWVDAGVSCTFNLPKTSTVQDVKRIYRDVYKAGGRAVSVYVEGSRDGILLFEFPKKAAKPHFCEESRPVDIVYNCAPKRPEILPCAVHQTAVAGEKHVVLVGMFNDKPFEVFCGSSDDIYLPQKCDSGFIIKQGGGKYGLQVKIRRSDVVYEDIANVLMDDEQKALTRMLSLCLRHGVYPQFIVDQLKKSNGSITTFSAAISRVLSKYIVDYVSKDNKCPMCGEYGLVFVEGCIQCENCDYSKCG